MSYYKHSDGAAIDRLYGLYEGQVTNAQPSGFGRIIGELPFTFIGYLQPDKYDFHEFHTSTA